MRLINPPHNTIFETFQPVDGLFTTNSQGCIVPDDEKIDDLRKRYDFFLINCSTEHWGSERDYPITARICDILLEHKCQNFVVLVHDPDDEKLRSQIMYFPFFAWQGKSRVNNIIPIKNKRTYFLSNLSRFARDFRIANYLMLLEKPYINRCLVRLYNMIQTNHDYYGHFDLTTKEINQWKKIQPTLPTKVSDGFKIVWHLDHLAFSDTYLHLVSESTSKNKIFLTEKTWQPIAAGQLFLVWGNTSIIRHLRTLGVDTFDDIIDHSYDLEINPRTRLEKIHREIDRLSDLDFEIIYENTQDRRMENLRKFVQGIFVAPYIKKLIDRLPPRKYNL